MIQPCRTCYEVRGWVVKTLDQLGMPWDRVAVFNRPGIIDGQARETYGVRVVKDGKVLLYDDPLALEGWPTYDQAMERAKFMQDTYGLKLLVNEFVSRPRIAASVVMYAQDKGVPK